MMAAFTVCVACGMVRSTAVSELKKYSTFNRFCHVSPLVMKTSNYSSKRGG